MLCFGSTNTGKGGGTFPNKTVCRYAISVGQFLSDVFIDVLSESPEGSTYVTRVQRTAEGHPISDTLHHGGRCS